MSSAGQTPDDGQTNPSQNAPQQKRQRVLACVLCQQRKIKCNRRFPCANCIKAGTPCIPATLTPRKRRFPERELLDRVRKYEEMLRQNNIKFDSLWKDNGAASTSPSAEGGDESDEDEDHDHPSEQRRALGTNKAEQRVEIKYATHQPREYSMLTPGLKGLLGAHRPRGLSTPSVRPQSSLTKMCSSKANETMAK